LTEEAEQQARARVGCVLDDKWTLERLLGVGGMAAVYSGRHRNGARAAVKILHADLSRHKEVRERFVREGYAANKVDHPGAVKVLDDDVVVSGAESGTAYIVMELLEGESLQDRLEHPPAVTEADFLAIAANVLDVLEAAHTRGVVHRDLKPENLFLVGPSTRDDGTEAPPASGAARVKVLDFGLARLLQGQAITSYGLALGTPSFMSPEQAAGRIDEIDGRTDLFALAATGFRICTGRRIHEAANPVELVRKMANLAAPRVRDVRPEVSVPCARVIDRALEFRREDRYEGAAAMREDVLRALAELEANDPARLAGGPTELAIPASVVAVARTERPGPVSLSQAVTTVNSKADGRPAPSNDMRTIELSGGDFREVSEAPAPAPARDAGQVPGRLDAPLALPPIDESIHIPRRRSVLPWVLLLALGIGGAKFWFHRRAVEAAAAGAAALPPPTPATVEPPAPSAALPAASAEAPVVVRDRDAGGDASTKPAASAAPGSSAKPPSASASGASATHHAPPGKVAPGTVHKAPHKHHGAKPHPTTPTTT
jgi:eukaryotic-like serine/threonine-protein kinase